MSRPIPTTAAGTTGPDGTGDLAAVFRRHRVVAVVRHTNTRAAGEIARACIAGGLGLIEITLTTPGAVSLIAELAQDVHEGVIIGAGTVLNSEQLHTVVDAGARFLVSPVIDAALLATAAAAGVPLVPGAATPSEIARGSRLGAPVVKVFPAGGLGLSFVKAVASVLPDVPLLPSGGISVADGARWLDAGAVAVAIGSELDAAHAAGGMTAVTELAATAARLAGHPSAAQHPTAQHPQTSGDPS